MALCPGYIPGPYEIVALAGKGGMGKLYRAHDITERFTRAARAIAALSHTGICR